MSYFIGTDGPVTSVPMNNAMEAVQDINNVLGVSVHAVLFSINHVIWNVDIDPNINTIFDVLDLVVGEFQSNAYQFRYVSSSI